MVLFAISFSCFLISSIVVSFYLTSPTHCYEPLFGRVRACNQSIKTFWSCLEYKITFILLPLFNDMESYLIVTVMSYRNFVWGCSHLKIGRFLGLILSWCDQIKKERGDTSQRCYPLCWFISIMTMCMGVFVEV